MVMLELQRGVKVFQVSKVKSSFFRQKHEKVWSAEHEVEAAVAVAVAEGSGLHLGGSGSAGLWLSLLC